MKLEALTAAEKQYKEKFGGNSLDRTIYIDPLMLTQDSVKEAIDTLKQAVENNKPIEQYPEEIWEKIIF